MSQVVPVNPVELAHVHVVVALLESVMIAGATDVSKRHLIGGGKGTRTTTHGGATTLGGPLTTITNNGTAISPVTAAMK